MWFKKSKSIGLALSSGAARGIAHIGAIEEILNTGYKISSIAGSSIGSIAGAYLSLYGNIEGLKRIALESDWKMIIGLVDLNFINLSQGGFIQGKKVESFLKEIFKDACFSDTKIPLSIIATDVLTGEAFEITQGEIWKAIRASIAIPGIFTPIKEGKRILIDGGVSMPLPAEVLIRKGVKVVWGVNVLSHPPQIKSKDDQVNIVENLIQSMFIMESAISNEQAKFCEKVICPKVNNFPFYDFTKAKELISLGKEAAKESLV